MNRRTFVLAVPLVALRSSSAQVGSSSRYGTWMGPTDSPEAPLPTGFAPFYPRVLWTRALGERTVAAFAVANNWLLTVEAERDKETGRSEPGVWRVYRRRMDADRFGAPEEIPALSTLLQNKAFDRITLLAIPQSALFCLRGASETTPFTQWGTVTAEGVYNAAPDAGAPEHPAGCFVAAADDAGFLAASHTGNTVSFVPAPVLGAVRSSARKSLLVPVRTPPISAAVLGTFTGTGTEFVAALGSSGDSPVSVAPVRGRNSLPDTEEEFAPGILEAWQIPGRSLPFLLTARNIGAEQGTDTPIGCAYLSLYNVAAQRWMTVWESPPLGNTITQVGSDTGGKNKIVLCRGADGRDKLVCLGP